MKHKVIIRSSEQLNEFATAFAQAQKNLLDAERESEGHHGSFASIEAVTAAIRPILSEQGISYTQPISCYQKEDGEWVFNCTTRLLHSSGQWQESTMSVPIDYNACNTNQQRAFEYGKATTYMRRYSLFSVCGIGAGDDPESDHKDEKPQIEKKSAPKKRTPTTEEIASKYIIEVQTIINKKDRSAFKKVETRLKKESKAVQQHLENDMLEARNYLSENMEPAAVKQEELM